MENPQSRCGPNQQTNVVDQLFRRILRSLAESDIFCGSATRPTSSIFIVYAHDNESMGTANAQCVHKLIEWLRVIRSRTLSDKWPTPLWGSREGGSDSVRSITSNQFCLLPSSTRSHSDKTVISSVDKVVLCGSEVLRRYYEHDFTASYIREITAVYQEFQNDSRDRLQSSIEEVVESHCGKEGFHHVLTELAFLQLRRSHGGGKRSINDGIVPIALDGHGVCYLPFLQKRELFLQLKSTAEDHLHALFFKLLAHLYHDEHSLINGFRDCYHRTREQLQKGVEGTRIKEIIDWNISKTVKSFRRDDIADFRRGRTESHHHPIAPLQPHDPTSFIRTQNVKPALRLEDAIARNRTQLIKQFVGRADVLSEINDKFMGSINTFERVAIYGLSGMGKTALAHQYANTSKESGYYDEVFLIDASEPAAFESTYNAIHGGSNIETPAEWLRQRSEERSWLLIIDNVTEYTARRLETLPHVGKSQGLCHHGHILITTVSNDLVTDFVTRRNLVQLTHLSLRDTQNLFLSVSQRDHCAKGLVSRLPRYPIFIRLVAALAADTGQDDAEIEHMLQSAAALRGLHIEPPLAKIFSNARNTLTKDQADFLTILAYLHTNVLDLRLLQDCLNAPKMSTRKRTGRIRDLLHLNRRGDGRVPEEKMARLRMILPEDCPITELLNLAKVFARLSLLERNGLAISVPGIFQTLLQQSLNGTEASEKEFFALSLALAIEMAKRQPWLQRDLAEPFVSVVAAITRHAEKHATETWEHLWLAEINFHAADYLCAKMWVHLGLQHYRRAMNHWNKAQRPDTIHELKFIGNYGLALLQQGEYDAADVQLRHAYQGFKRLKGRYSLDAIWTNINIVFSLQERGQSTQAEREFRKLLDKYEKPYLRGKIGSTEWNHLKSALALNLRDQGRYQESLELLQEALKQLLEQFMDVLGSDSEDNGQRDSTLIDIYTIWHSIGLVKLNLGIYQVCDTIFKSIIDESVSITDIASVVDLQFRHFEDVEVKNGDVYEHIRFDSRLNLGASLIEQERYTEAAAHFKGFLEEFNNHMEPAESGETKMLSRYDRLLLREGAAFCSLFCGHHAEAEKAFEDLRRECGQADEGAAWIPQQVFRIKEGLAMARGFRGKAGAEGEFDDLIRLTRAHLGENHPDLYTTYHRLAMVSETRGEELEASRWYREASLGRQRTLGLEHPLTQQSVRKAEVVGNSIQSGGPLFGGLAGTTSAG